MNGMFAGVDLGGTKIAGALADADGRIVRTETIPTQSHEGPGAVLARIAQLVADLSGGARIDALGVGVPGLVDLGTGTTLFFPNLPTQWRGVPAAATLRGRLGCPVLLLNDCRAATLGELHYGLGRGVRDMVLFMLGTGIGGGLVIDRKLRLGPLGAAGEIGHQTVLPDGPLFGCGKRGCLQGVASGPAIAALAMTFLEFIGIFLYWAYWTRRSHGPKYGFAIGLPDNPTTGGFKSSSLQILRAWCSSNYR